MTLADLKSRLESLLFVADGPVTLARLEKILDDERPRLEQALAELSEEYLTRGLRIQRLNGRVQMVTAPESAAAVESFLGLDSEARLSAAAMEALAIIAYRQPITRGGIEAIRGVNSDHVVALLTSRGLIEECGRADGPGRAVLFGTTFEFLQYFGLGSLQELPPAPEQNLLSAPDTAGEEAADERAL